jgi:hypothetical protein
MTTTHDKVLIALMGATITNLMDDMARIENAAHDPTTTKADIARIANNAIEATKALTKAET